MVPGEDCVDTKVVKGPPHVAHAQAPKYVKTSPTCVADGIGNSLGSVSFCILHLVCGSATAVACHVAHCCLLSLQRFCCDLQCSGCGSFSLNCCWCSVTFHTVAAAATAASSAAAAAAVPGQCAAAAVSAEGAHSTWWVCMLLCAMYQTAAYRTLWLN